MGVDSARSPLKADEAQKRIKAGDLRRATRFTWATLERPSAVSPSNRAILAGALRLFETPRHTHSGAAAAFARRTSNSPQLSRTGNLSI